MRIYVLRHEDRTMDLTFFSPLTKNGLDNSIDLIKYLEKEKINIVYSSPYIRTLQTIYPYCKKYNIKQNLDYSLTELYQEENIPKKSYQITLPEYIAQSFNFNDEYISSILPHDIVFPENVRDFNKRIKDLLRNIIKDNYKSNNSILLVTHQGVIDSILHTILKKNNNVKNNLGDIKYPKGGITKIFDNNNWTIDKINW